MATLFLVAVHVTGGAGGLVEHRTEAFFRLFDGLESCAAIGEASELVGGQAGQGSAKLGDRLVGNDAGGEYSDGYQGQGNTTGTTGPHHCLLWRSGGKETAKGYLHRKERLDRLSQALCPDFR